MNPARLHLATTAFAALVLAASASLVITPPLVAAESTWDGGSASTSNWTDPANWTGDTLVPGANDTAITLAGTTRTTINLNENYTLRTLSIASDAGAFILNTDSDKILSIHGAGSSADAVTNNSANPFTINAGLKLLGSTRFSAVSGDMKLGKIDLNSSGAYFRALAGRTITLAGEISGSATLVEYTGSGNYLITAENTYTAGTRIRSGSLRIATSSGAFGTSGTVTLGYASVPGQNLSILTETAASVTNRINLAHASGNTYTLGGSSADTSSYSSIQLASTQDDITLSVTAAAGGRVDITGNVTDSTSATGAGTLDKTGAGIVALHAAGNTYKGATNVTAGTLLINGTLSADGAAVTVRKDAILGGNNGTIRRAVTLESGAILSAGEIDPASGDSLIGLLTFASGLTLASDSVLAFDIGPAGNDRINITGGTLTLDGILDINAVEGFDAGTWTLLSITGATLVDNGLILGTLPAGFTYALDWQSAGGTHNLNLIVTAIPEPAVTALATALIIALAPLTFLTRRRTR
ncbi:hypothetical protein OPIT5_08015 [Opitutaceae bacterium TAV5]|nr:hypothetical protein OPIT5_08015 [Opitutaceae bacterium TAV5]